MFRFINPGAIQSIGGFLGQRYEANRAKRIKDPILSEQYIRLHENKNTDDWFWMGEQIGKWLDAAAYSGLISRDPALLNRVDELLGRLEKAQEEDGYLGILSRRHRFPARGMELYEMYYVLHGLLVCDELLQHPAALKIARRLGDFILRYWGPEPGQFPLAGRHPGNGHDGGEGTLILEPIVLLGQRSGDTRYIEWGERCLAHWDEWLERYPESRFSCGYTAMKQFAAGEKDVYELRPAIHAHTFHMTVLGLAALYNATGKSEYQQVTLGIVDRLAAEWIFLTGGMSSGEGYLPRRYYNARNDIEVCPQHTWMLLLNQALAWTGKAQYAAEVERDLFNQFFAAQLADGSNWSYMTPLNGHAQEPEGPNCCNGSGQRLAARAPTYLYGLLQGSPAIMHYSTSAAVLPLPENNTLRLEQNTHFPSDGQVSIQIDPAQPAVFDLHLRIPPYAQGATLSINGGAPIPATAGAYAPLRRQWNPGDRVDLNLPLPITCQANGSWLAIQRGPLVYAYFQDAQPDPAIFYSRHGLYPEDVSVCLDPANPAASIVEAPAAEGQLGPALHVPGMAKAQPPMFAGVQGNQAQNLAKTQTLALLPFANQGAVRGEYRVMMEYRSE